jgi:hypothetical protein
MSDGRRAACPFDDSGHGRCEKKMTSTSFTMLCDSIATTVGAARRRIARYGEATLDAGGAVEVVAILVGWGDRADGATCGTVSTKVYGARRSGAGEARWDPPRRDRLFVGARAKDERCVTGEAVAPRRMDDATYPTSV